MTIRPRAAWLFLACLLGAATWPGARAAENPFDHYQHAKWTQEDGAPAQIAALAQGRDGYLWIGAGLGVYRFDGRRFDKFQPASGEKLREAPVYSLLGTADGSIWVGYDDAGIARIRDGRVTMYGKADGIDKGTVGSLAEGPAGSLWATQVSELVRFDGRAWEHIAAGQRGFPTPLTFYTAFVDRQATVWVSTSAGLFARAAGQAGFTGVMPDAGMVVEFAQSPDGTLWLARTDEQVVRLAVDQGRITQRLATIPAPMTGIRFDDRGQLWTGAFADGVRVVPFAGTGAAFDEAAFNRGAHLGEAEGLSDNQVWPSLIDRQGNIWFGTKGGLDRFRRKDFVTASRLASAALVAAADGGVWAASQRQPVQHLGGDPLMTSTVPAFVTAASRDAAGAAWFAGSKGIWRIAGGRTGHVAPLPPVDAMGWAAAVLHDHDHVLWLSLPQAGVGRLVGGTWVPVPDGQRFARALIEDPDGRVWRSSRGDVLRQDAHGGWTRYGSKDGLDLDDVLVIQPLGHGRVAVGAREGFAVLDQQGRRFDALKLADGQAVRGVGAILQSGDGAIWLHALEGIFRIPAGEWQHAMRDPSYAMAFRMFGIADGVPGQPTVLPAPTGVVAQDGQLWFATSNGVIRVDPSTLTEPDAPPPLAITAFSADGVSLTPTGVIHLPAGTTQVQIGYTGLDLGFPERVHFRYRLGNVDGAWHDRADQREASYTRLGPGTYRFDLIGAGGNGRWSDTPASITFDIAPFIYQTTGFRVACAGALVLLIVALVLWRMRAVAHHIRLRIDGRMAERVRIARDLHDTVLQGFQGLLMQVDAAARTLPDGDPALPGLRRSRELAQHLLEEGRERIVRMRSVPLADASFVDELYAELAQLGAARGIPVQVVATGDSRRLSLLARDEVGAIALEAVCNALTHGTPSLVRVTFELEARRVILRVTDDGPGVQLTDGEPPAKAERWGITGMRERARRLGATLAFASAPGEGFTVTLTVPASRACRSRWRAWFDRQTGLTGRS